MDFKAMDWIEHPVFGLGRVTSAREDRLDIQFINAGAKTIVRTTQLKPSVSPAPDFTFAFEKKKSRSRQRKAAVVVDASFENFVKSR